MGIKITIIREEEEDEQKHKHIDVVDLWKPEKDVLKDRYNCICGGHYTHTNKHNHEKTVKHKKHMEYIKNKNKRIIQFIVNN